MRPVSEVKPTEEPKALAKPERAPLAFVPSTLDDAWRIAELLSKAQILPDALKGKPHDLLVVLMTGTELGLSPMQSVREIYVVKGKGFISTLMKQALVKQSPACKYITLIESTEKAATYETQRVGEPKPVRMSFTIEQAKQAGLMGNDNWSKWPAVMLRKRCASQLLDEVFPDVTRGIYTSDDEMLTMEPTETLRRLDATEGVRPPPVPEKTPSEEEKPITGEVEFPASEALPPADDDMMAAIATADASSIDALVRRVSAMPKGDAQRAKYGNAINLRRRELKGGA